MADLSVRHPDLSSLPPSSAARWASLQLLRDAHAEAVRLGHDPWEFAVELSDLHRAGLTRTDVVA